MDVIILIILIVLLTLVFILFFKLSRTGEGKDRFELMLNDKFTNFHDGVRETMDNTRKEVERSKDILSENAVKTLEHIKNMSDTITNLVRQQEKAQELGRSLEYLLQTPKLRGNYGEAILEEMLERILPRGIWEKQYTIEGGEKVDAVVKYKNVIIPIDSKFPRDDYQKYIAAKDQSEKRTHWNNYEKALKVQINSMRDKYIKPEKGTTEFAVLFIPSESIYYETIAEKNYLGDPCEIHEYATSHKVIPVSPNTFYAFLNVIILGIRNIEIAKDAQKLQEALSKLDRDFINFYRKYEIIGKALEKALEAYQTGEGHINRFKKDLEVSIKPDMKLRQETAGGILEKAD